MIYFPFAICSLEPGNGNVSNPSATSPSSSATNFGLIAAQIGGAATAEVDVTSRSYVSVGVPRIVKLPWAILKSWIWSCSIIVLNIVQVPFNVTDKVASRTDAAMEDIPWPCTCKSDVELWKFLEEMKCCKCTEMRFNFCTWFGEISSCSCSAWPCRVLFNKICKD